MSDLSKIDFENLTTAQFEEVLPDLFDNGGGKVSDDPRLIEFLAANPDCAALVSDLETIAEHARSLFEPTEEQEPSDSVWSNIANKLKSESAEQDVPSAIAPPAEPA
jgi:hypothetical protein